VAAQLRHRALHPQPAARDDADAVADLLDLAEQVAGEQDGPVAVAEASGELYLPDPPPVSEPS